MPPSQSHQSKEELRQQFELYERKAKCFLAGDTCTEYLQAQCRCTELEANRSVFGGILAVKFFIGVCTAFYRQSVTSIPFYFDLPLVALLSWHAFNSWLYFRLVGSSPGQVDPLKSNCETLAESSLSSFCDKCRIHRPPLAHHCRHCNVCIPRMDHHCQFLLTCVGQNNFRPFVSYVFNMFGLCVCATIIACKYYSQEWVLENARKGHLVLPWDVLSFVPALAFYISFFSVLGFGWLTLTLAWQSSWNILEDIPTLQRIINLSTQRRQSRQKYEEQVRRRLHPNEGGGNPNQKSGETSELLDQKSGFTSGDSKQHEYYPPIHEPLFRWQNWKEFFGDLWWCPFIPPPQFMMHGKL